MEQAGVEDMFDLHLSTCLKLSEFLCLYVCSTVFGVCLVIKLKCCVVLRILLFSVCCGVDVATKVLLEFRYFTVPFLLLRLHLTLPNSRGAVAELLLYSSVNMVTLWLFLYRPFRRPHEEEWQRFMW